MFYFCLAYRFVLQFYIGYRCYYHIYLDGNVFYFNIYIYMLLSASWLLKLDIMSVALVFNHCIHNNKNRIFFLKKRFSTTPCNVCGQTVCVCGVLPYLSALTPPPSNVLKNLILVKNALIPYFSILNQHVNEHAINTESDAKTLLFQLINNLSVGSDIGRLMVAVIVAAVNMCNTLYEQKNNPQFQANATPLTVNEICQQLLQVKSIAGYITNPGLPSNYKPSQKDTVTAEALMHKIFQGDKNLTDDEKTVLSVLRYIVNMIIKSENLKDKLSALILAELRNPKSPEAELLREALRNVKNVALPLGLSSLTMSNCCARLRLIFQQNILNFDKILDISKRDNSLEFKNLVYRAASELFKCKRWLLEGKKIDLNAFHVLVQVVVREAELMFYKKPNFRDEYSNSACSFHTTKLFQELKQNINYVNLRKLLNPLVNDFFSFLTVNFKNINKCVNCELELKWRAPAGSDLIVFNSKVVAPTGKAVAPTDTVVK